MTSYTFVGTRVNDSLLAQTADEVVHEEAAQVL